jgi:hypothetical protein
METRMTMFSASDVHCQLRASCESTIPAPSHEIKHSFSMTEVCGEDPSNLPGWVQSPLGFKVSFSEAPHFGNALHLWALPMLKQLCKGCHEHIHIQRSEGVGEEQIFCLLFRREGSTISLMSTYSLKIRPIKE